MAVRAGRIAASQDRGAWAAAAQNSQVLCALSAWLEVLPPMEAEHIGMPPRAASAACITVDFTDARHSKATARRAAIWLKRWATRAEITAGLIGKLDETGNWLGGAKSQRHCWLVLSPLILRSSARKRG